eukprot:1391798-Amorphochlora_amoeboformis.AAC.2
MIGAHIHHPIAIALRFSLTFCVINVDYNTHSGARVLYKTLNLKSAVKYKREVIRKYLSEISAAQFNVYTSHPTTSTEAETLAKQLKSWKSTQNSSIGTDRKAGKKWLGSEFGEGMKVNPPTRNLPKAAFSEYLDQPTGSAPVVADRKADSKQKQEETLSGRAHLKKPPEYDYDWLLKECEKYATFTEYGEPIITE